MSKIPTKNEAARSICVPRWEGKGNTPKVDPCEGCPLYGPCINEAPYYGGMEAFVRWIDGINRAADKIGRQIEE